MAADGTPPDEDEFIDPDLIAEAADLDDLHAFRARFDGAAFASYVLRDEETAAPVALAPMHEEWHALANTHRHLLIWAAVESGKTQQMSIARALFALGQNPNLRVAIVMNTDLQAQKLCSTIGRYITSSPQFKKVFPGIVPADGMPWTSNQLYVKRPAAQGTHPSVRTCGVHGNILGSRIDLLILDDILDYENTRTEYQRKELYQWIKSTVLTRVTRKGRVLVHGTAWHRDDLLHHFSQQSDFMAVRYPVMDEDENLLWPERWPRERIEEKRSLWGIVEFNRSLLCIARSDEESRFKKTWIDSCLARGRGRPYTDALKQIPDGYHVYTGVDLGVRTKDGSDLSVLFTIIVYPDGTREVLDVESGRWDGPGIVARIVRKHFLYQSIIICEDNAAQQFIVDFTKKSQAIPIRSFTTTGQKKHHPEFGLESMAIEMEQTKWVIPCDLASNPRQPAVAKWIEEMLFYDPSGHAGDHLMASWFAREGFRLTRPKAKLRTVDLVSR